ARSCRRSRRSCPSARARRWRRRPLWKTTRAASRGTDVSLPLSRAVELLSELSPLRYAEPWDNVGLLLGVAPEGTALPLVTRVLFAIDLTQAVIEEALARR